MSHKNQDKVKDQKQVLKPNNKEPLLHWLSLNFRSQKLEQIFQQYSYPFEIKMFNMVSIYFHLFFFIEIFHNYFDHHLPIIAILRIVQLVSVMICTVFAKKRLFHAQLGILFLFVTEQIVSSIYSYELYFSTFEKRGLVLYGMNILVNLISFLIMIRKWYMRGLCILTQLIAVLIHFSDCIYNISYTIIISAIVILCSYLYEKYLKMNFYQQAIYEQNLKDWKKLMNEHIPIVVFKAHLSIDSNNLCPKLDKIIDYSFDNQACRNLLQHHKIKDIDQLVKMVVIDSEFPSDDLQYIEIQNKNLEQVIQEKLLKAAEQQISQANLCLSDMQISNGYFSLHCKLQSPNNKLSSGGCNNESILYFQVEFVQISTIEYVIIMNDQSQQQRIEILQHLNQYKNKMLQSVTHELKTPLNGMIQILEASKNCNDMSTMHELHLIVKNNAFLLNYMVNQILDYCNILKQNFKLKLELINLRHTIQEVVDIFMYQINTKQLNFTLKFNIEPEPEIFSDKMRLQEVLLVVIQNAIKYTEKGEIVMEVNQVDTGLIEISIEDTGVGMNQQKMQCLSKFFSQSLKQLQNMQHGIGLGLTIAHNLLQFLGPSQKIQVNSVLNLGSKFSFTIHNKASQPTHRPSTKLSGLELEIEEQKLSKQTIYSEQSSHKVTEQQYQQPINTVPSVNLLTEQKSNHNIIITQLQQQQHLNQTIFYKEQNDYIISKDKRNSIELDIENIQHEFSERQYKQNQINVLPQFSNHYSILNIEGSSKIDINNGFKSMSNISYKFLLVDDIPYNILGLQLLLKSSQLQCKQEFAYNGKQALEKIIEAQEKQQQYTAIFLDINMPIMDGVEVTKAIRQLEREKLIDNIKIIIVTTLSTEQERQNYVNMGADILLPKPVLAESLNQVLDELFNQQNKVNQKFQQEIN